jgi:hypothetical protein
MAWEWLWQWHAGTYELLQPHKILLRRIYSSFLLAVPCRIDNSLGALLWGVNEVESMEVWLASGCEAAVPHSAVGVHVLWCCNDLCDGKVDIMCVANSWRDATEPSKCSMDLKDIHTIFFCKNPTLALKWILAHNEKKSTYSILPKYGA